MSTMRVVSACISATLVLAYCSMPSPTQRSFSAEGVAMAATATTSAGDSGVASIPISIGYDGKLSGPLSGYGWVAGCPTCAIQSPSPCNRQGCYQNTGGKLCIRASIPALSCRLTPRLSCDWDKNWGVVVGFNPKLDESPWSLNPKSISVQYEGAQDALTLNAHIKGDPDAVQYCKRNYRSGQPISAGELRTKCWEEGGTPLRSFEQVDHFNLQQPPDFEALRANYCITGITVTP